MRLSALLAPLLDAKADHELIRKQLLAFEAEQDNALEERRKADAARQAKKRERDAMSRDAMSRDVTLRHSDRPLTSEGAHVEDKTSNSGIEPQTNKQTRERETSAFDTWYRAYPHKVQRGAAERAFPRALEAAGSLEALVTGVQRYVATKPPDRQWQNPATWLNGKGWLDVPAAVVVPMAREGPSNLNLSRLYATQERMENAQQLEPAETSFRYLSAPNR